MASGDAGSPDAQGVDRAQRNALTRADDGHYGFTTLPGWTAHQLLVRGFWMQLAGTAFVPLIVVESYFPGKWYYWGGGFGAASLSLFGVSLTLTLRGQAKMRREKAHGYATMFLDAKEHPQLYYLTGDDLQVISRPFAPRPPDGRRRVVRAFAGLPDEPLYRTRARRPPMPLAPPTGPSAKHVDEHGRGDEPIARRRQW